MKNFYALALISVCASFSSWATADQYGAELTLTNAISIDQAIAATDAGNKDPLLIEGEVTTVCQQKGCWMGFATENSEIRVTFKDYGFFVPLNIVGKNVIAEGTLEKVTHSLKDSKHLVKDAGGDPDTVIEPIVEYQMVASGVKVKS